MRAIERAVLFFMVIEGVACARRETLPDAPAPAPAPAEAVASAPAPPVAPAPSAPAGPRLTDFNCTLAVRGAPASMKAGGAAVSFAVTVTNGSKAGETWLAMRPDRSVLHVVNLGSRWFSPAGAAEGERTPLTSDLAPGQSATLTLIVKPPAAPGAYELRIEPVQEAVAWFHDLRGCSASVAVNVGG